LLIEAGDDLFCYNGTASTNKTEQGQPALAGVSLVPRLVLNFGSFM